MKIALVSGLVAIVVTTCVAWLAPHQAAAPAQTLGSIAGPDMPYSYIKWGAGNGVRVWPTAARLTQASTTVCSIISPLSTSTLESAGIKVDTASSTATILEIGQSSNPTATTTLIGGTYHIAAGGQAFVQASTSPTSSTVFAPSTYLVFKMQGGVTNGDTATAAQAAGFLPTGACQASFTEYPTI